MSKYRCCCFHVETGALITGIAGLVLSLALLNPFGILASLVLLLAYAMLRNHCRAVYTAYIVMMSIAIFWSILILAGAIVIAVKPEWYLQEVAKSARWAGGTMEETQIRFIIVAVVTFFTVLLFAWFISVAVRAREYVSEPYRRPVADAHDAPYVTDGVKDRCAQSHQVCQFRICSTAC